MRKVLWIIGVLGLLMIAAPFALGFPSKASHGQDMLDNFHPLMQQANVDKTAAYYNDVFVPLGAVVPAMSQENVTKFNAYLDGIKGMQTDSEKLVPGLAQALNMTPEQVQGFLATNYPAMSQMLAGLPQMSADFGSLLGVMSSQRRHLPAGARRPQALRATRHHDADERRQLRQRQQPAELPLVHLVLRVARSVDVRARRMGSVLQRAAPSGVLPPPPTCPHGRCRSLTGGTPASRTAAQVRSTNRQIIDRGAAQPRSAGLGSR